MIKNLDRIVEVKFTNKENPELAAELFQDGNSMGRYGILSGEEVREFLRMRNGGRLESETELSWHVLYVEDKTKLPVYKWGFPGPKEYAVRDLKKELRVFLEEYGGNNFTDLLFFLGIASSFKSYKDGPVVYNPTVEMLPQYKFKPNPVVDDLLKDTRGFILWKHQIRTLLNLFSGDREWINSTAKRIDMHNPNAEENARKLKFADDLSLFDVIKERMPMSDTIEPHIREAYILFNVLTGGR